MQICPSGREGTTLSPQDKGWTRHPLKVRAGLILVYIYIYTYIYTYASTYTCRYAYK